MEEAARRGNGFEVALEVVSRRKWLALLTFAGVFTAVVSVVTFLPDFYRSSATVIIDRQQIPEEFVKATVTSAVETRLQTISQEILSRSRLESLINRFGLYNNLKKHLQLEAVIERMRQDIRLELKQVERRGPEGATVAFNISYNGKDPQTVALVTNTLASFYIEENLKARERQAVGTSQFLRVQLEEMKKKLDEYERRVSEFKERYMGELPQQQDANLAILERLNTQLRLNSDSQIRTSEQRAALAKQLAEAEQVERTGAAARETRAAHRRTDAGAGGAPNPLHRQIPQRHSHQVGPGSPGGTARQSQEQSGTREKAVNAAQSLRPAITPVHQRSGHRDQGAESGSRNSERARLACTSSVSRPRHGGSRSSRGWRGTMSRRKRVTVHYRSGTRKLNWRRAWSNARRGSSSG